MNEPQIPPSVMQPQQNEAIDPRLLNAYRQVMQPEEYESQPSAFGRIEDENLIKWQLELDNILERVDHLLRGHKLTFDKKGNMIWKTPSNSDEVIFNDYGVNEVLRILQMYLNRNTILSNYTQEEIDAKVYDFGIEVSDMIEFKYEDMGLDKEKKMTLYPMILRQLIDVIHSAYQRALKGGERQSLREARTVNQSGGIMPQGMPMNMMPMQQQRRGLFGRIFNAGGRG